MLLCALLACAASACQCSAVPVFSPAKTNAWSLWAWGPQEVGSYAGLVVVDGFDTSAKTIRKLRANGEKVVCYMSAGTLESWRPDIESFNSAAMGHKMTEWAGETWFDITQWENLKPGMCAHQVICE